jgi:hypothetical protein
MGRTKKDEFATEIAGTLGAYATANQVSVEGIKKSAQSKKSPDQDLLKPEWLQQQKTLRVK